MIHHAHTQTAMSVAQLRALERVGLAQGLPLMQRAGLAAANFAHERLKPDQSVLVLVGPGNNGGDALVAAAELVALGHRVTVLMPEQAAHAPDDARAALAQWQALGRCVETHLPNKRPEFVIDGLFGIGLSRPLDQPWQTLIDQVNAYQAPTLALDIPSGLHADTGQALGRPLKADWTLSFIAPNLACAMTQVDGVCGQCFVEDLGMKD